MGQSELRMLPTDSDISKNLYAYEIKPYVVKHDDNDSCITETSAINLLNMYCSTLMKSKFVRLVPIWKVYKTESHDGTLFQVFSDIWFIYILYYDSRYMNKYIYIYCI